MDDVTMKVQLFSIYCSKTKIKVITPTNDKVHSRPEANQRSK